ncbi:unnamed protein product [Phytophthora lilii]|uniref:Unnamed protein product n=1 Tax=Phytophthora lilii TaxID=2077276 RepID=A0A9W6UCQ8_9STRA|nr:unnamed protein product [Phytophthora lilii]
MEKSFESMLQLMHSMADTMARLQQDVNDLKKQNYCCSACGKGTISSTRSHRVVPVSTDAAPSTVTQTASINGRPSTVYDRSTEVLPIATTVLVPTEPKEDPINRAPRKPSLGAAMLFQDGHVDTSSTTSRGKSLSVINAKSIHKLGDGLSNTARSSQTGEAMDYIGSSTARDCSPEMLSSREKEGRQPMLADLLWKRSNADGALLKHSPEERNAARRRRQLRSRCSLPSGVSFVAVACDGTVVAAPNSSTDSNDHDIRSNTGATSTELQETQRKPLEAKSTAMLNSDPSLSYACAAQSQQRWAQTLVTTCDGGLVGWVFDDRHVGATAVVDIAS